MNRKWWHGKVAYQIYPKSFLDTNGDGIGDLPGIISKLDYLKDLGVDIIWLSPIYKSPLADQGYDISDYYSIDPRFGTMEDMDRLISEAKKRDMYILMDLVVNHCSDEHEWFQKACEDPDGEYGNYFYIRDMKDGKYPTNWRSYFGGPAWDVLPGHPDKCYMHVFHKKQPDLNWENETVRQEIYKMVNWWLDKGLGGFRIDAIINIKKPEILHDYPADRDDGLCATRNMVLEAKGVEILLNELKDNTFKPHEAFTVGEVFDVDEDNIGNFISDDGCFSSMFDFSTKLIGASSEGWYADRPVTPEEYIRTVIHSQLQLQDIGFLSNIIENHDEPRGVSHYIPAEGLCIASKKMLATINLMIKGLPFIFQGQEIGMENCPFPTIEDIDDVSTKDEYEVALRAGLNNEEAMAVMRNMSRDNARTPMQWDDSKNAGFTVGTPWLMVNPNYKEINVAAQLQEEDSLREYYKKLIRLRKDPEYFETVVYGRFSEYEQPYGKVMAFTRTADRKLLVLASFDDNQVDIILHNDTKIKKVLINNLNSVDIKQVNITQTKEIEQVDITTTCISLRPYQALVMEV